MKVYTLDRDDIIQSSKLLAQKILENNFKPQLIIGIKTGGIYISDPMYEFFSEHFELEYTTVKLSRALTKKKKLIKIDKLLKFLPYFVLDFMRNIEVCLYELTKEKDYNPNREKDVEVNKDLENLLLNISKVLIINDAIDTGKTLLSVKNRLLKVNNKLEIKTAVLTNTHKKNYIDVDYQLYDRILLRCPWANDYKGK